jgi:hypothetical protein
MFRSTPYQWGSLQVRTQHKSARESKGWKIEKIDPSSHKIWGLCRAGHNAYYLGKLLRRLSASAFFNEASLSSTELPTEAVEQNLPKDIGTSFSTFLAAFFSPFQTALRPSPHSSRRMLLQQLICHCCSSSQHTVSGMSPFPRGSTIGLA